MTETKNMTLARALKEKNRIAGKLATLRDRISRENSWEDNSRPRNFDVLKLYNEAEILEQNLVSVKTAIAIANAGIVKKIIELAEVKSKIKWLCGISTKQGVFSENSYGNKIDRTFTVIISGQEIVEKCNQLQEKANDLQDEIDEYNASTRINVALETVE